VRIGLAVTVQATGVQALATLAAYGAEDHPLFQPTRDVTVVYAVQPGGLAGPQEGATLTVSTSANGERQRIEPSGAPNYTILDRTNARLTVVFTEGHMYLELPFDPRLQTILMLNDTMKFTRAGSATIAGLTCTEWDVEAGKHHGRACITNDGVILRADGGGARQSDIVVAQSVEYAPLPASRFQPPVDFRRAEAPVKGNPGGAPARP
jgi:hypothetical protein